MYDVIIIGSGIAGLTSTIYALNNQKKVLILEKQNYGGQIINSLLVDNYPGFSKISGFDLATSIYNQVKELGGNIKYEEVKEITKDKEVITDKNKYQTKTIIIATGTETRKLNVVGEDKFTGRGVSYCATCDGNFYKDKEVMVVGGGNTALEEAIYLSSICKKVFLVYRREEFRKEIYLSNTLKTKENIEVIFNSTIEKINGNELLESVDIKNNKTNEITNKKISGLFVAIGKNPNNAIFKNIINLSEAGYVNSDNNCHTNIPGVFVAGDVREKDLRQLITASSDGAIAATEAIKYINN